MGIFGQTLRWQCFTLPIGVFTKLHNYKLMIARFQTPSYVLANSQLYPCKLIVCLRQTPNHITSEQGFLVRKPLNSRENLSLSLRVTIWLITIKQESVTLKSIEICNKSGNTSLQNEVLNVQCLPKKGQKVKSQCRVSEELVNSQCIVENESRH